MKLGICVADGILLLNPLIERKAVVTYISSNFHPSAIQELVSTVGGTLRLHA